MRFDDVNNKIITIRNQNVILDSDVAVLYGVQTRDINKSVKNNPDKFLEGYIFQLKVNEFDELRLLAENSKQPDNQGAVENFHRNLTTNHLATNFEKTRVIPTAFTEKGLYMLATILKSPLATQTTIAIVETFAKLKQLSECITTLSTMDVEAIEPEVIEKTGGLLNDLVFSGIPTAAETSVELNLGVMKLKRSVKSEASTLQQQLDDIQKTMKDIQKQLKDKK